MIFGLRSLSLQGVGRALRRRHSRIEWRGRVAAEDDGRRGQEARHGGSDARLRRSSSDPQRFVSALVTLLSALTSRRDDHHPTYSKPKRCARVQRACLHPNSCPSASFGGVQRTLDSEEQQKPRSSHKPSCTYIIESSWLPGKFSKITGERNAYTEFPTAGS